VLMPILQFECVANFVYRARTTKREDGGRVEGNRGSTFFSFFLFSKVYLFFFSIKSYMPRKNATYFAIRDTYNYHKFARHPKG
jgi:hypothetical protein